MNTARQPRQKIFEPEQEVRSQLSKQNPFQNLRQGTTITASQIAANQTKLRQHGRRSATRFMCKEERKVDERDSLLIAR